MIKKAAFFTLVLILLAIPVLSTTKYWLGDGVNLSIANIFFVDTDSQKVGVGTTEPSESLTVSGGNISLDNKTTDESNYIKFGKGGYIYDNGTDLVIGHN